MVSRFLWRLSAAYLSSVGMKQRDFCDRRPLVMTQEAAREWMRQDIGGKEAEKIAADGAVSADKFIWHCVTRAVGNAKNQGPELIEPLN
ncbi:hypothetical protein B4U36_10880 [Klebsiella pneumoniae]|nr:hypothetical protein B4U36_10880 [Klebsiella pneumoniae]